MIKVTRPTLLLDEKKCRANIRRMAEKARTTGVQLRPHFKTHQSAAVGEWFRSEGVDTCTVSSVKMAAYFADAGWKDITLAFPLNALEADEINRIASSCRFNVTAVGTEEINLLLPKLQHPVGCFIEIDSGYRRTGIRPDQKELLDRTVAAMEGSLLSFKGILTHAGNSYACRNAVDLLQLHKSTAKLMKDVGDRYRKRFPHLVVSIGDTPTCSVANDFEGIQEIRPGNFVFYDWMQVNIGSCRAGDVAIAMACPVVAVYPERSEIVVHGGAVHFSKDQIRNADGSSNFGQGVEWTDSGWGNPNKLYLKGMSQEHGILQADNEAIQKIKPGDVVGILPIHSCLTADVMGTYTTLDGKVLAMGR